MIWKFRITMTPMTSEDTMDPEDASESLFVTGFFQDVFIGMEATDEDTPSQDLAQDLALDWFHCEYAIAVLDDFDISIQPAPTSAHELMGYQHLVGVQADDAIAIDA